MRTCPVIAETVSLSALWVFAPSWSSIRTPSRGQWPASPDSIRGARGEKSARLTGVACWKLANWTPTNGLLRAGSVTLRWAISIITRSAELWEQWEVCCWLMHTGKQLGNWTWVAIWKSTFLESVRCSRSTPLAEIGNGTWQMHQIPVRDNNVCADSHALQFSSFHPVRPSLIHLSVLFGYHLERFEPCLWN